MLEFKLLGPLEVARDGSVVTLGGPKQRAALAVLLLQANRVVPVDRIADDLYAGRPPVTAVTQVQRQISELRQALGASSGIETHAPGYRIRVEADQVDLGRFERLHAEALLLLRQQDAESASVLLREALALFRGPPLADLADETFARIAAERIEEMRLAAVEARIDADLACGRHRELTTELRELTGVHPYRESLHAQRMLALYRSGRQAEALQCFRELRATLVETLGLEPGATLRRLERAILDQDAGLELESEPRQAPAGSAVLVLPSSDTTIATLGRLAQPLVHGNGAELLVTRLLQDERELSGAVAALARARSALDVPVRTAAFTTAAHTEDVIRLVNAYDVELIVADAPGGFDALPPHLGALLARSPVDVSVLIDDYTGAGDGIFVPFGGAEDDWAALELGARMAATTRQRLVLVGTEANVARGQRDASRALADASLAVQRLLGIDAEPLLTTPSIESLLRAVEPASLVVLGQPLPVRSEGGRGRSTVLARDARPPRLLVHHGPRPGALAPPGARTRFTWSLSDYPYGVA